MGAASVVRQAEGGAATAWHALAVPAVEDLVRTSGGGLSKAEAEARLERHGPNRR